MTNQDDVITFLHSVFSGRIGFPTVIKTHVSIVFLAGDTAYKMKKAVKFPFLDFTSLAARKIACEKEIKINKRTAPTIYKRVVAVTSEPEGLALDGPGEPVEYLVEMDRFDETTVFDQLITPPGKLRRKLMEALADEIATFHMAADVKLTSGGCEGTRKIAENNKQSFDVLPSDVFENDSVQSVTRKTLDRIDNAELHLTKRQKNGHVRVCHGDLHLRNICLVDGQPTMFDAIEFSDDFSDIDTMYDLAFLLMDLDFRGERRLASLVLNRYLDVLTEDVDTFHVLPIFLSMRAQIRAHVGAAAASAQSEPDKIQSELDAARQYLSLAATYLSSSPARLVAVGGLSGSGKSRLAREIAPFFSQGVGARVLRSDVERKRLSAVHPNKSLGVEGYTPEMTKKTFDHLFQMAKDVLETGQSVVLDAVFASPAHRSAAEQIAKELGIEFQGIWVDASDEIRLARIQKRQNNVSDVTPEIALQQSNYDLGEMNWIKVDSSGEKHKTVKSAQTVLSKVFMELQ
ncbi:AAA family ATPase [Rhodospirillales bacterium]|nr:AAA family ATPase [Rhodospirillales bacterium]